MSHALAAASRRTGKGLHVAAQHFTYKNRARSAGPNNRAGGDEEVRIARGAARQQVLQPVAPRISTMRETNPRTGAPKPAGSPHAMFNAETPQASRQIAGNGAEQAKETYAKMSAAAAVASGLIQAGCTTAAKGAAEYNAKVMQIAHTNVNAAFDYARDISGVGSPSELVEVMAGHARKGFDVFSEQTRELTALAHKVASDTTEPLKAGFAKAFRGPVS